jgi:putative transcriptional regulator
MAGTFQSRQGQLLLDGGKLHGSFFHRAVVLICQHDTEGAFGLILNRPSGGKVGDAIAGNLPGTVKEQPLYIGGPVQPSALSFLHSDAFVPHANVMLNLNIGHSIESLMDLTESYSTTQKLRLFAGYAGWSAGQLDQEMARQDWLTYPADLNVIFNSSPAGLWKDILLQHKDPALRWLADSPENPFWN